MALETSAKDVELVPAAELTGLLETAYLLRSPRNARRLLTALRRAERRGATAGKTLYKVRTEIAGLPR